MKKLAVIFLLLSYSMSIIGVTVKSFYCCGKLKSFSISFADNDQKKNSEKGGSFGNDCCKTKYQSFQVKDNHFITDEVKLPSKYFTQTVYDLSGFSSFNLISLEAKCGYQTHAPPLLQRNIPLYISNCVYRI